jgi:hypothetical protein
LLVYALLALIITYGLSLRLPAINPEALWLDDAWVALACKVQSWGETFIISTSSPLPYTVLNRVIYSWVRDEEVALQLLPLVSSLLQAPLLYFIVLRLTGSRLYGLFGALLICVTPSALFYSVRAKQYLVDSLCVSTLLLVFVNNARSRIPVGMYGACLASALAFLFSYVTIVLSWPFLHATAIARLSNGAQSRESWEERSYRRRGVVMPLFALNIFMVAYYILVLKRQSSGRLAAYWQKYFLSIDEGVSAYLGEAIGRVVEVFLAAIPVRAVSLTPKIILLSAGCAGFFRLARQRALWPLAFSLASSFAGLVVLSTMRIYPFGGGRTDIFLIPISITLLSVGLHGISTTTASFMSTNAMGKRFPIIRSAQEVLFTAILVLPLITHANKYSLGREPVSYPNEGGTKRYVRFLSHALRRDGGAIIHPMGRYTLCLYSRWMCRVERSQYGWGWDLKLPDRIPIAILPGGTPLESTASVLKALESIGLGNKRRIFFFGTHMRGREYFFDNVRNELVSRGYRERARRKRKGALLTLFQRDDLPPREHSIKRGP